MKKIKEEFSKQKQTITRELDFLKSQFNSHLSFNFFNFCYSEIYQHSEKTAQAIDWFTDMLRYNLEVHHTPVIKLKQEIDYIHSYIEVQKIVTSDLYVELNTEQCTTDVDIVPRIIATIVEHTFQRGILSGKENTIKINIESNANCLTLKSSCRIKNKDDNEYWLLEERKLRQVLTLFYSNYNLCIQVNKNLLNYSLSINFLTN